MQPLRELLQEVREECSDLGKELYNGRTVVCFAIVDDIEDGYNLAQSCPGRYGPVTIDGDELAGRQMRSLTLRGSDVFRLNQLPKTTTFVYPEHTLVPRQQVMFFAALTKLHPEVETIIIITTSAVIVSDMLSASVRQIRNETARERLDAIRL